MGITFLCPLARQACPVQCTFTWLRKDSSALPQQQCSSTIADIRLQICTKRRSNPHLEGTNPVFYYVFGPRTDHHCKRCDIVFCDIFGHSDGRRRQRMLSSDARVASTQASGRALRLFIYTSLNGRPVCFSAEVSSDWPLWAGVLRYPLR